MKIRHKVWLEKNGKTIFCKGRQELLRSIDELQSLSAAAKKLNMSYRAAWGKLKISEERLGVKLTCLQAHGKGMSLTAEARALLNKFDELQRDASSFFNDYVHNFSSGKRIKKHLKTNNKVVEHFSK
jgi:molybdate transport system regulatory protein